MSRTRRELLQQGGGVAAASVAGAAACPSVAGGDLHATAAATVARCWNGRTQTEEEIDRLEPFRTLELQPT
jgi:hypothetical protein